MLPSAGPRSCSWRSAPLGCPHGKPAHSGLASTSCRRTSWRPWRDGASGVGVCVKRAGLDALADGLDAHARELGGLGDGDQLRRPGCESRPATTGRRVRCPPTSPGNIVAVPGRQAEKPLGHGLHDFLHLGRVAVDDAGPVERQRAPLLRLHGVLERIGRFAVELHERLRTAGIWSAPGTIWPSCQSSLRSTYCIVNCRTMRSTSVRFSSFVMSVNS